MRGRSDRVKRGHRRQAPGVDLFVTAGELASEGVPIGPRPAAPSERTVPLGELDEAVRRTAMAMVQTLARARRHTPSIEVTA